MDLQDNDGGKTKKSIVAYINAKLKDIYGISISRLRNGRYTLESFIEISNLPGS